MTIKDSGQRTEYENGFVRDMHEGKGRMDLLPWRAIIEVAKHCEEGAKKYGERNIDLGCPQHSLIDSAFRHLAKYTIGMNDEDHLRACAWNILWCLEQEITHPEMRDIPARMKIEEWRDSEVDGYEVSSLGRLRNKRSGAVHKGQINQKGYVTVCLYLGKGKSRTVRLHRLIAKAFIPNPENLPEVNHKNGNKLDNSIYNLEWISREGNMKHAWETGLCTNKPYRVTAEQIEYIRKNCVKGDSQFGVRAIARKLGISHTTVKDIVNNKRFPVEESERRCVEMTCFHNSDGFCQSVSDTWEPSFGQQCPDFSED